VTQGEKSVKNRVHLGLTSSVQARDQEIERRIVLGARPAGVAQTGAESGAQAWSAPIQAVRRVRSAGSSSTAKGRVMRPGVPATSVVRVTYRPRLKEQATTFGVPCSSTRQ
jgi:hypothetical protein